MWCVYICGVCMCVWCVHICDVCSVCIYVVCGVCIIFTLYVTIIDISLLMKNNWCGPLRLVTAAVLC